MKKLSIQQPSVQQTSVQQTAIATLLAAGAVFTGALTGGAAAAQAATLSFSTPAIVGTGFNTQNSALPKFDTSLGQLTNVTVSLTGRYQLFTGIESEDEQPGYVYAYAGLYSYGYLFLNGYDFKLTENQTADSGTLSVGAFDGVVDYAGNSGRTVQIDHKLSASRSFDITSKELSAFMGNGTFNTYLTSGMYGYGWAYGSNFTIRRSARVTDLAIRTTYDYKAAPEPILASSLLGFGLLLVNRRSVNKR